MSRAVFFDIDEIADRTTALPHMLPTPAEFSRHMSALGLSSNDFIVVYDTRGVVQRRARLVDLPGLRARRGGRARRRLKKWKAETVPSHGSGHARGPPLPRQAPAGLVRGIEQMRRNIETRREQVLDARSRGRFYGTEPEPRQGSARATSRQLQPAL